MVVPSRVGGADAIFECWNTRLGGIPNSLEVFFFGICSFMHFLVDFHSFFLHSDYIIFSLSDLSCCSQRCQQPGGEGAVKLFMFLTRKNLNFFLG